MTVSGLILEICYGVGPKPLRRKTAFHGFKRGVIILTEPSALFFNATGRSVADIRMSGKSRIIAKWIFALQNAQRSEFF